MVIETKYFYYLGIAIISYVMLDIFFDAQFFTSLGIALFVFIFLKFFNDLGNKIEIRDIMSMIGVLQWVVAPAIAYQIAPDHPIFYMAVTEETYMSFLVPACYALVIGMYIPLGRNLSIAGKQLDEIKEYMKENKNLPYILIAIGFVSGSVSNYVPASLGFLLFLLGNMQFVGLFMLMVAEGAKYKWLVFGGVMFLLVSASIAQGMFHQLILWLFFMFLMFAFIFKFNNQLKFIMMSLGFLLIFLIQSVKEEYRMATWYGAQVQTSQTDVFLDIVTSRLLNPSYLVSPIVIENITIRMNQGWIIARILRHVPKREPFAKGETVETAVWASLLPRVLNPNKAVAGGQTNFERFTGTPLNKNTSMDLSVAGEAWANFGYTGGILFMFIMGLFYNIVLTRLVIIARKHPTLVLWIPLLFFQVIKAETDLATVLNHLVKSIMVVALIFWGFKTFLKIKM